jgi:RNA polymerase sigma-70 factor (ECF subfamily)
MTLLARLRHDPSDTSAWHEFVRRYGARIIQWSRRWGLQEADARDVAQNVLLEIAKKISRFQYKAGGSFRGWLRKLTRAAWCDFLDRRKAWHRGHGGEKTLRTLETAAARDDLVARLEDQFDHELVRVAMHNVKNRVQPQTWEAFRLLAIEELSGEQSARRLKMKLGSTFAAKSKVQRMIREEIKRLERFEEEA